MLIPIFTPWKTITWLTINLLAGLLLVLYGISYSTTIIAFIATFLMVFNGTIYYYIAPNNGRKLYGALLFTFSIMLSVFLLAGLITGLMLLFNF